MPPQRRGLSQTRQTWMPCGGGGEADREAVNGRYFGNRRWHAGEVPPRSRYSYTFALGHRSSRMAGKQRVSGPGYFPSASDPCISCAAPAADDESPGWAGRGLYSVVTCSYPAPQAEDRGGAGSSCPDRNGARGWIPDSGEGAIDRGCRSSRPRHVSTRLARPVIQPAGSPWNQASYRPECRSSHAVTATPSPDRKPRE